MNPNDDRLMAMTEFKREQILEKRADERQKRLNRRQLDDIVRQQQRGGAADDSVSRAAKRTRIQLQLTSNSRAVKVLIDKF